MDKDLDNLEDKEILGLDGVSEILEKEIQNLSEKIRNGRIKDPKKEEVRIKMIRTLAYLSKTYARIKEAQKVEELEKKIEILEKAQKMSKR
ncbi:hypothetical protein [Methanobacterium spitsbergense]|uniref:DUF8136 domain-containing protein n=1 Tax=Methanobacterium spitsbergense TaxID=2874285 RepID=A0A8T5V2F5_9EURY|nr:hypothetical protein [Methanobacterium spitsbergense]MBZ2167129.1 hypothetical protein [Methanobacterium spitsbergense]